MKISSQISILEQESRTVSETVLDPGACRTMADVRAGVDALDRQLVALLAQRQGYMDAAARIKSDRKTVRDDVRVEEVIARVNAAAREAGLSELIAEPVWRTLIDRSIAYEFEKWDTLRPQRL